MSASHSTLIDSQGLQLAPSIGQSIGHHLKTEISLFAGSFYFENADEESAYCNFIGVIPRPRNNEHVKALEDGLINDIRFVERKNRHTILINKFQEF